MTGGARQPGGRVDRLGDESVAEESPGSEGQGGC